MRISHEDSRTLRLLNERILELQAKRDALTIQLCAKYQVDYPTLEALIVNQRQGK